jgi:hypothetical protein
MVRINARKGPVAPEELQEAVPLGCNPPEREEVEHGLSM